MMIAILCLGKASALGDFHGVTVRGPSLVGVPFWSDAVALRAWTLNNIVGY
jgi:hypothetical protein